MVFVRRFDELIRARRYALFVAFNDNAVIEISIVVWRDIDGATCYEYRPWRFFEELADDLAIFMLCLARNCARVDNSQVCITWLTFQDPAARDELCCDAVGFGPIDLAAECCYCE